MLRSDLVGRVFNRLTAVKYVATISGDAHWLCHCACGAEKVIAAKRLKSAQIKSCGCLRREAKYPVLLKHGEARRGSLTSLHIVWQGIKQRCLNPSCKSYRWYGELGVSIDPSWLEYAVFRDWAHANGYAPGLVIDREDAAGHYAPANCRWITAEENNARTRRWGTVTTPRPRKHRIRYKRNEAGRFESSF